MGDDNVGMIVGVPMDRTVPGFEPFDIAEAEALYHCHRGPFPGLRAVCPAPRAEDANRALRPTAQVREVYRFIARDADRIMCDVRLDVEDG